MEMIEEMDADKGGSVDKYEFLRYMLITMGKVEPDDLSKIMGMFNELDVDGSGFIDKEDIIRSLREKSEGSSPVKSELACGSSILPEMPSRGASRAALQSPLLSR